MKGETSIVTLNINDVLPNRFQPRIRFNDDKIGELAESIKKYGVIQPIIVRQIGDKFEIIAGERRYKASVLADQSTIPAIINNLDDKDSSEVALIENVQREDLTPIEEAISYKKILDMGYLTQENLADKLGVSQSAVANKLRLLQLSDTVQEALLESKISERHARSLLKLKKDDIQIEMLNRIIKERLTVRRADEEIEKIIHNEKNIDDKTKEIIPTQEEIEVLNILNTYKEKKESNTQIKEEKKEETEMNPNDPMNQFAIPEVSIIDDNPQKEEILAPQENTQVVPKIDVSEPIVLPNVGAIIPDNNVSPVMEEINSIENVENSSNPGFMDIDRIKREAVDISQKEELAPMNNLLSSEQNLNTNIPPVEEISSMPKGRFFDVMPSIQDVQPTNESPENYNFVGDSSSVFGINPTSNYVSPAQENSANMDNSFSSILEDPIIQPINIPTPEQSTPVVESAPMAPSVFESAPVIPNVESTNIYQAPLESAPIVDYSSMVSELPQMTDIIQPSSPTYTEDLGIELPELNLSGSSDIPKMEPINIPMPSINIPTMETPSIMSPVVEPLLNSAMNIPEVSSIPVVPVPENTPPPENIRKAINVIRDAVDELDRLGFHVDTDEMDLENIYQVIIKINKG